MALTPRDRSALEAAVDRTELAGAGIGYVGVDTCEVVRNPQRNSGPPVYVVFEVIPDANPNPVRATPARESRLGSELLGLGLSCGSTAVWAIGTFAFAAAAAPTGGVSGIGAYAAGAATVASGIQCAASAWRVYNETTGQGATNDALDAAPLYQGTMLVLDGAQLLGAGAALGSAKAMARAAGRGGTSMTALARGESVSRPMRRAITAALGNPGGAKRIAAEALTARARAEFLSMLGVGLDLSGSATGGILNQLAVWIVAAPAPAH